MMQTIQIKRNFTEEVEVTKIEKRTVTKTIDIDVLDLTKKDVNLLKHQDLKSVAFTFMNAYRELLKISLQQNDLLKHFNKEPVGIVDVDTIDTDDDVDTDTTPGGSDTTDTPLNLFAGTMKTPTVRKTLKPITRGHNNRREPILGNNTGTSSIYHYTFLNKTEKKWKTCYGNLSFDDEISAALQADIETEKFKDGKTRPLNRNEFPEIMNAYKERNHHQG